MLCSWKISVHSLPLDASLLATTARTGSNKLSGVTYCQRSEFELPIVVSKVTCMYEMTM